MQNTKTKNVKKFRGSSLCQVNKHADASYNDSEEDEEKNKNKKK